MIGGPMGAGKTTIGQALKNRLPNCAFLDGDWCWDMHPFCVTEAKKKLVLDNICHVLSNFIACNEFENVIFCWVLHEQSTIDEILSRLELNEWKLISVSLICTESELVSRLQRDIDAGIRSSDVIARSLERLQHYSGIDSVIYVSGGSRRGNKSNSGDLKSPLFIFHPLAQRPSPATVSFLGHSG